MTASSINYFPDAVKDDVKEVEETWRMEFCAVVLMMIGMMTVFVYTLDGISKVIHLFP